MADFGYDVADYRDVDPIFGTLADFDRLSTTPTRAACKVLLDFVPNHTSDQHPWFLESRSVAHDPRSATGTSGRDPRRAAAPPNNWLSVFGGRPGSGTSRPGQYYYHAFLSEQPDLNWRNPEVRAAMHDVLRFWLDRGVDGFRVDVMWHLDQGRPAARQPAGPRLARSRRPGSSAGCSHLHGRSPRGRTTSSPTCARVARRVRRPRADRRDLPAARAAGRPTTARTRRPGAHLPFNFQLLSCPGTPTRSAAPIAAYEAALPAARLAQLGAGQPRPAAHRDARRPRAGARRRDAAADPARHADAVLRRRARHGRRADPAGAASRTLRGSTGPDGGRDPERTPMRWDGAPGAGFTTGDAVAAAGRRPGARTTSPRSATTRHRRSTSTAGCWRCGGRRPHCRSAPGRRWRPKATCSPTSGRTRVAGSWSP